MRVVFKRPWKIFLGLSGSKGHIGKWIDGFNGARDEYRFSEKNVQERLLEFCNNKKLHVANTGFEKEQMKITSSMGRNKTEIDFVLVDKRNRKYLCTQYMECFKK